MAFGEELRVLWAHSMRGHHTAKARRHDPPGPRRVKRISVLDCLQCDGTGTVRLDPGPGNRPTRSGR